MKSLYYALPSHERNEFMAWAHAQQGTSPQTSAKSGGGNMMKSLVPLFIALLVCVVIGGVGYAGYSWYQVEQERIANETAKERDARERNEPRNPKNLAFIKKNLGKEITIQGVPEDFDIGYLFFSKKRNSALRLKCMDGPVVSIQSTQLEEMIKSKKKIQVQGIIEYDERDRAYQILVTHASQIQTFE